MTGSTDGVGVAVVGPGVVVALDDVVVSAALEGGL
jgi:hypothetical protein